MTVSQTLRLEALLGGWLACATLVSAAQAQTDLPDGFEQILPRGRIAAITNPKFVPGTSADVRDHSWVLGVVIEGQARAFSLNLLNLHEVVNDQVGQTPYAAVW